MDALSNWFIVLAFFAGVLLLEGLYLVWNSYRGPEAKHISRRLQAMSISSSSEAATIVKNRLFSESPWLNRLLLKLPRVQLIDRLLLQSGLQMNVATLLALTVALAVIAMLVGMFFALPKLVVVALALVGGLLPILYVMRAKDSRLVAIETQLPDALDLIARAMRAGHAFPSALQMVADEMPQPIAGEFKITFDEINFGIPQQEALKNLAMRVPSSDVRYFVIAALIQRESGGNLAELLGSIATLVRERLKLFAKIRVLSAEGRLSAWILTLLPFVLAGVISVVNPGFIRQLWEDPVGLNMIWGALGLMVVGIFWMSRMIKIRV